ncbi:MAG: response regulator transcription factor [Acidobacteriaceae bacterium]|nr:response regulator transcription factor [Acidobacteriaceae bacterium]
MDDYEPWRRYVRSILQTRQQYEVIGEVSDGLEAVKKARDLQPDVILLDVGLPGLHGIEAARRIRECAPKVKILFATADLSRDAAEEAFRTGAQAYIWKGDAESELLIAMNAVLGGNKFIGSTFEQR